ncbi:MAG TPA: class I SAM-dependent methyltransferase [Acetobacteraceae bacterium]|jgi:predicted O-methyltransferase YrrM
MNAVSIISRVRRLLTRVTKIFIRVRYQHNVDIALSGLLGDGRSLTGKNDAAAYVGFLRACIEPTKLHIEVIKSVENHRDADATRFATLIDALRHVPPVPAGTALAIADRADWFRGSTLPCDEERWAGDVGLAFSIASASGYKGRILSAIVRLCGAKQCLELGTAFGLSAMFIIEQQQRLGCGCHLTTVEGSNPQFELARDHLTKAYGAAVTCHFGFTQKLLPELARATGPIDFMFHDAGHSREDYVNDFGAIVDALAPGCAVLIDDIRWEDARFYRGVPNTYGGWREVVAHPRVRRAIEIDGAMGLMQLA